MAHESVVGIVPFRSLGVQPDTAVDDKIAELAEQRHQQFLKQVDQVHPAVRVQHELAIGTHQRDALRNCFGQRGVVFDRALRVLEQVFERFDPVGNVGIAKDRLTEQFAEPGRVEPGG